MLKIKIKATGQIIEVKDFSRIIIDEENEEIRELGLNEVFDDTNPHHTWNCAGRIDCSINEELFLAIAALRDDTDKNQWFTDGDKWILCPEIKFSTYWAYNDVDINTDTIHKATVNELIEHFKV